MTLARSRKNDPAGMRNRVLDVAAAAFQSRGFLATSTHDIVRSAGITGGALHHHFPSKKSLALAVIADRVATEVAETWIKTVRDAPTAAAGIVAVFSVVATSLDERGSVSGCPLGNLALELSLADEELRVALLQEYDAWREAISSKLQADAAAGRAAFASGDPDGFANVVVALFSGAMTIAKAEQGSGAVKACLDQLRRTMADDL